MLEFVVGGHVVASVWRHWNDAVNASPSNSSPIAITCGNCNCTSYIAQA